MSLPLRECGLKWTKDFRRGRRIIVTPLAGVWIEIAYEVTEITEAAESLPLRECGLKLFDRLFRRSDIWSLPLRECGLKCVDSVHFAWDRYVTPLAGVWIEIIK